MRIGIITMWYNEELLAPFFFRHYSYVDEIHILLDTATKDDTCSTFWMHPNVKVEPFTFEDGFNDRIKQGKINELLKTKKDFDWIIAVDADEFVFSLYESVPSFLFKTREGIVYTDMWTVFRHATEHDLDYSKPPVFQRRYGDPLFKGIHKFWRKPAVVRPQIPLTWGMGCHRIVNREKINLKFCRERLQGVHWANADPIISIRRRLASRQRQSEYNLKNNLQRHNHAVTEDRMRKLCLDHENDLKLF